MLKFLIICFVAIFFLKDLLLAIGEFFGDVLIPSVIEVFDGLGEVVFRFSEMFIAFPSMIISLVVVSLGFLIFNFIFR